MLAPASYEAETSPRFSAFQCKPTTDGISPLKSVPFPLMWLSPQLKMNKGKVMGGAGPLTPDLGGLFTPIVLPVIVELPRYDDDWNDPTLTPTPLPLILEPTIDTVTPIALIPDPGLLLAMLSDMATVVDPPVAKEGSMTIPLLLSVAMT